MRSQLITNSWNKTVLLLSVICASLISSFGIAKQAFPGGIYEFTMPPKAVDVFYEEKPVLIFDNTALVGISLSAPLGIHEITLVDSKGQRSTHRFSVTEKIYSEQHINFKNESLVTPSPSTLDRIFLESKQMKDSYLLFSKPSTQDLSPFQQPITGPITSLFGHKRILNGKKRNPHSGLDIAAPEGTKIKAPAQGVVILTGDFYFNGKTIFLDHGQGLITMYCHLQHIDKVVGDAVDRDDVIGLVGKTGRATGPHLHWSVSLNGNRVDPQELIKILRSTNL